MVVELTTKNAFRLLMEGQDALTQVEENGIRIDVEYLHRMLDETALKLEQMECTIKKDEVWAEWKKIHGDRANLDSDKQLGNVIFDVMGVPCLKRTPTGRPKTDEEALEQVQFPFVQKLMVMRKLRRARTNNLMAILNEVVDGFLHPMYSLNTTITYRSSGSYPNPQNFPNRDEKVARLVRSAFIPRSSDYRILEVDMKGAEVCVGACYHKDPRMIDYIQRGHDYHKDLAMQCYKLEASQVTKLVRGTAKMGFVFSSFYGDWFVSIAEKLWTAIETDGLKTVDGVCLKEHLKKHGIFELGPLDKNPKPGTFVAHIKEVYDYFWGELFSVYAQWKVDFWEAYLKKGEYQTHTGFTCRGIMRRNEAINYPIQGSSFHCLLWSLIKINKWLIDNGMRSKIIGQIHDSILFDVHKDELRDVSLKCHEVMKNDIRKAWPWIIVQLDIESEIAYKNWFQKESYALGA